MATCMEIRSWRNSGQIPSWQIKKKEPNPYNFPYFLPIDFSFFLFFLYEVLIAVGTPGEREKSGHLLILLFVSKLGQVMCCAPRFDAAVVVVFHWWVGFPLWLKRNKKGGNQTGCFFDCRFPPFLFFKGKANKKIKESGRFIVGRIENGELLFIHDNFFFFFQCGVRDGLDFLFLCEKLFESAFFLFFGCCCCCCCNPLGKF